MKHIFIAFLALVFLSTPVYAEVPQSTTFTVNFDTGQVLVDGVEYTPKLSDFENIEELEAFLKDDSTDSHVYFTAKDGVVKFNEQCEDRAFQLRDNATLIGKRLGTEALERHEYFKWYGTWLEPNRYHMICKAFIGNNDVWYIEPSNDKHWIGLNLD